MSTQHYVQASLGNRLVEAPQRAAPAVVRSRVNLANLPQSALNDIIRDQITAGTTAQEEENAAQLDANYLITYLGCLSGIALDILAPHKPGGLAIIGTGPVAAAQIEAALAVRSFTKISIYGRQPVAAAALAKKYRNQTGAEISVVASPEVAVHSADVVILASEHAETVIDADWVRPTAHVSAIISSGEARQPLPKGLMQRARTIASNDPEALGGKVIRTQDVVSGNVVHLSTLLGKFNPDTHREMTVFISADPTALAQAAAKTLGQS